MDNEDNLLAGHDLSAWEVPPPPAGLADEVIRRARDPMPHVRPPRSLRGWFIGAGLLAALVAVLALVLWGVERAPADGSGDVRASLPRALELGPSSAMLDAGAHVTWRRRGHALTVAQGRGAATWKVGGHDTVVIDAGATVASVEASGASLRVEVQMNRSEMRAIGVGSASAIVVALVTVIVYEGHVRATSGGKTVTIEPGVAMEFRGAAPPPEQLSVGAAPADPRIRELEAEVARLRLELAAKTDDTCDQVSCVLNNYEGACCAKFKQPACDAAAAKQQGDDHLANGMDVPALASYENAIACEDTADVRRVAFLAACRSRQAGKAREHFARLPVKQHSQLAQICVRYGVDPSPVVAQKAPKPVPASCDAEAAKKKGDDYLAEGMDTAALAQFDRSYACKKDEGVARLGFLAACRSRNQKKAQKYFEALPPKQLATYAQICIRSGISVKEPVPCDAKALNTKGTDLYAQGQYAASLTAYEASLACKHELVVVKRAFLAACNATNAKQAQKHYRAIPAPERTALSQVCIRQGIALSE